MQNRGFAWQRKSCTLIDPHKSRIPNPLMSLSVCIGNHIARYTLLQHTSKPYCNLLQAAFFHPAVHTGFEVQQDHFANHPRAPWHHGLGEGVYRLTKVYRVGGSCVSGFFVHTCHEALNKHEGGVSTSWRSPGLIIQRLPATS